MTKPRPSQSTRRRHSRVDAWFVLFAALAFSLLLTSAAWAQPPGAPVVVAPVLRTNITPKQAFVGGVRPVKRAIIGSAVDGRVDRFLVEEGDFVGGADETPAHLAQLEVGTIDTLVAAAKAKLDQLQVEYDEAVDTDQPEKDQAKFRMEAAKALWDFARDKLERNERLRRSQAVTEEELLRSVSVAAETRQLYEAAKANYELVRRRKPVERAKAALNVQQAVYDELVLRRQKYTIRCPFAGYVVAKHTEQGAWVKSGDPVAEVLQATPAEIEVAIPERQLSAIRPGEQVEIRFPSLGQSLLGKVQAIVPDAALDTRTFPVKIHVSNPEISGADAEPSPDDPSKKAAKQHLLRPGMLAHVWLPVDDERRDALVVPKDALVIDGERATIWVVDLAEGSEAQGTARPVPVQLGAETGHAIAVRGNVAPGELVVVEGNERLRPPFAVQIAKRLDTAEVIGKAK